MYQGLLKLLDVNSKKKEQQADPTTKKSSRSREVGKLVMCVALGNAITIQGKDE